MEHYDWPALVGELIRLVRLKSTPVGIQLCKTREEMLAVPRVRVPAPGQVFNGCQLVGQAVRLNFTVGFTRENLSGAECEAAFGLCSRQKLLENTELCGVWFATAADTRKHQEAMFCIDGGYEAVVASPLASGRLPQPDVCLIYASPQQVMLMGNALQYEDYEAISCQFVGESACTDSWTRAIVTGKPAIALPCYGERRYGGVLDDEMAIAFPPCYLPKLLDGLHKLSKNGLRYPAACYGVQNDARAGMKKSYGSK